ncbi:50S ribosomal protein L7/L12 [Fodinicola acaciae]|uniref:50S ribosomal protein L7/L12 n=1 Tax=Fodinicola acaciae TaxID=2681555 RepID=UPI0013D28E08|nr:50S ribosomal protein L7/L12 [Fodinicola acaciae]
MWWPYVLIGVCAVVFFLIALAVARASGRIPARPAAGPIHQVPIGPDTLVEIRASLARGQKILAIKQLREATGLGLADAKRLADAMEAGHQPPSRGGQASERKPDLARRVRELRAAGRDMEAVQLVADETGMGLADAERFVRSLD